MTRDRHDESGVALLVVLLVITLLTVVVVELTYSAQIETHLTFSGRNALQAMYLARSGVNVAEIVLQSEQQLAQALSSASNPAVDGETDMWAQPMPPMPVGDGTVALRVRDEARFLNLNDLVNADKLIDPDAVVVAQRLFTSLSVPVDVLHAIIDWIDRDNDPTPSPAGAEQPFYLGLTPPVRVRNDALLTVRELRLVRGVTPAVLAQLAEYVTALPRSTHGLQVNVNTAPRPVLMALDPALNGDIVNRIMEQRRTKPFQNLNEFVTATGVQLADRGLVRFGSQYFRIESVGEVNDVRRGITTVVERGGGSGTSRSSMRRVSWVPNTSPRSLTSLPASDFLRTLPPLGGSG